MFASPAQQQISVRYVDQLGSPVAGRKNWIGPFQDHEGRCRPLPNIFVNFVQPSLHLLHKVLSCTSAIYGAPDLANIFVNPAKRASAERQNLLRQTITATFGNVARGYRAHLAMFLRDEEVGLQSSDSFCGGVVKRQAIFASQ